MSKVFSETISRCGEEIEELLLRQPPPEAGVQECKDMIAEKVSLQLLKMELVRIKSAGEASENAEKEAQALQNSLRGEALARYSEQLGRMPVFTQMVRKKAAELENTDMDAMQALRKLAGDDGMSLKEEYVRELRLRGRGNSMSRQVRTALDKAPHREAQSHSGLRTGPESRNALKR